MHEYITDVLIWTMPLQILILIGALLLCVDWMAYKIHVVRTDGLMIGHVHATGCEV
jgi:hypothetical protein